ncbi:MAG: glutaminase A [Limnochordia bacterium]|jgi:glutaminase
MCLSLIDALEEAWRRAQTVLDLGRVATYIPELAKADPSRLGVVVYSGSATRAAVGDTATPFTLQSVAKVIALTLALWRLGPEPVLDRVGMEPTGEPFNSLAKLESTGESGPLNPMINSGAIAVCGLLVENMGYAAAWRELTYLAGRMCAPGFFGINEAVYRSEEATAHRNRAMAHLLRDLDILRVSAEETVDLYIRLCALEVNCDGLAHMGLVFARLVPLGISDHILRIVNAFLVTCGMYDRSGEFAVRVGIPAKSGVSGAIMACVPGRMGIGLVGPALESKGNSVGGLALLGHLSAGLGLSMF